MNILVVKMSSMGDVIHALPALADAHRHIAGLSFDWVVETAFQDIPALHPLVSEVIPVGIRRWRKHWLASLRHHEINEFIHQLRQKEYDLVIDAQGLIKSAIVSTLARGPVSGFDASSARESLAPLAYRRAHRVALDQHAIDRQRQLFAAALGYTVEGPVDYGLMQGLPGQDALQDSSSIPPGESRKPMIMLLHGTTWPSKMWPLGHWQSLCRRASVEGFDVLVPAGNEFELEQAQQISADTGAKVLSGMSLSDLSVVIARCAGVVSVDTGLGHLAAALNRPLVGLYGPTDPGLTGVHGQWQKTVVSDHLSCIPCRKRNCQYAHEADSSKIYPPCFQHTTPELVWQALLSQINRVTSSRD